MIEEFREEALGPDVDKLLRRAPERTRTDWSDLVSIACRRGDATDGKFAKVLIQIRNNVAFHYAQPKPLAAGFRAHFFESPPNPTNEHAYCSFGRNMERTRFYFADAAVQGALKDIQESMGPNNAFIKNLARARDAMNRALAHLIEEYTRPARKR